MEKIDARNQECPAPVLMTRDRVEKQKPQKVTVVVSNDASRQNVARYLASAGYQVTDEAVGDDFHVMGERTGQMTTHQAKPLKPLCMTRRRGAKSWSWSQQIAWVLATRYSG
jgi:TusA-related sulfurtransferase